MRLVTFEIQTPLGPRQRLGLWRPPDILDVNLAYEGLLCRSEEVDFAHRLAGVLLPANMLAWIKAGERGRQAVWEVAQRWRDADMLYGPDGQPAVFTEGNVHLLAPLPRPNTIRDFSTYEEHQRRVTRAKGSSEVPVQWYHMPIYWKANPENTVGPDVDVVWPDYTQHLDYELEYGIYIGRTGRDIPVERASEYIAGFTIFNDISARDQQAQEMVMTFGPAKGKDFDTAKIMGPCLVTPDEFGEGSHRMTARVNGKIWSEGATDGMYWSFAQIISYISKFETLKPGDFLGSGACPTGCGIELNRWICPGDTLELEIEGIGVLRNRVVKP